MFKRKYESLVEGCFIDNPDVDIKSGKTVGKYKVSAKAIYRPDNKYFPKKAIVEVIQDKGSVHVTGCCIGCVKTDRLVIKADNIACAFDFDSIKQIEKVRNILGI